MKYKTSLLYVSTLAISLLVVPAARAQDQIRVVATLPTYAAIAREITGDHGDVRSIARGDEDAHFVNPRPSFAALLQRADVFISTGLDLELWVPSLLDRANNQKIVEGGPGHVVAYSGVELLDIPENVSRTGGDVHVFGNPHIHTDPINAVLVARNIARVLKRVDPDNAALYDENNQAFEDRVIRRLFGDRIVELLGAETIFDLARSGQFWEFVGELARSGGVRQEFTFTGGVARNPAAVEALRGLIKENYGQQTLNISPDSIYTGALGAALFALRGDREAA